MHLHLDLKENYLGFIFVVLTIAAIGSDNILLTVIIGKIQRVNIHYINHI